MITPLPLTGNARHDHDAISPAPKANRKQRQHFGTGSQGENKRPLGNIHVNSGQILQRASADREENLLVPVDLQASDTTRTHWPFLRDRRIDAYQDLTRRFVD